MFSKVSVLLFAFVSVSAFCSFEIRKNNFTNILTPSFKSQYSKCIFARFGSINTTPTYGEIEDNVFINFELGIYYEANQMDHFYVERNRFAGFNTSNGTAIYLRQNRPHQIEIRNNVINNTPLFKGWYGIRVQNAVQPGGLVIIEKNTIKNVRHAIWTTNYYNGVRILDNNPEFNSIGAIPAGIYYPNTTPSTFSVGIKVENCPRTQVINNLIQKQNPNPSTAFNNLLYGISIETNGISSHIRENEVRRLGKGLNFYGQPNAPLRVTCNGMYENRVGLSLNNTFIGDQGLPNPGGIAQDNQWSIPNGYLGVARTLSSPITTWYTRNTSLPFFPQALQMDPVGVALISGNASGSPYNCYFGCPNPPCLPVEIEKMVRKEAPFDQINNEERKMVDIQLYRELKTQAEYLNTGTTTDSLFASYIDSLENTNIARIYRFNEKLELGDTLGAYIEVMNITPDFTPEDNHKIVNEIYWRTWVYDIFEFSPADSAALLFVAVQHPHQGGTAVYDARVMLRLDFYDFDDDLQKSQLSSEEDVFLLNKSIENEIFLFPNPTNSIINYEIELTQAENAELLLFDMMGRKVFCLSMNGDNLNGIIDVSSLSSGVYNFEMRPDSGQAIIGKIVINQ